MGRSRKPFWVHVAPTALQICLMDSNVKKGAVEDYSQKCPSWLKSMQVSKVSFMKKRKEKTFSKYSYIYILYFYKWGYS